MAVLVRRALFETHKSFLSNSPFSITCKNGMAAFPPYFVEPVFRKTKLSALIESGEVTKLGSLPVKPPLAHETCSEFYDEIASKFTNYIMKMGQKKLARSLLEKTFENIKRSQIERYHLTTDQEAKSKIEMNPKVILHQAIVNCQPLLQLTPIKRGGATYQVPVPVTESRSRFLAQKWLLEAAKERDRKKVHLPDQLAWELMDAANNRGRVIKRKQDLHKQCEANRAYAHYRWG